MFRASALAAFGLLFTALAHPAIAQNLVTNGSFAITGNAGNQVSAQIGSGGALCASNTSACTSRETVAGWAGGAFASTYLASGEATSGLPAFALLANVSMTKVPEPATWALMLTGVGGLIGVRRRRAPRASFAGAV